MLYSSYRDLDIYVESKALALIIHEITLTLPNFEKFEEGSQLRRSSKAVTSLLVEGYGRRRYKADYIKFLVICLAECDEVIIHLDFVFETKSWSDEKMYREVRERYDILSKKINRFIKWVEGHL